MYQTLNDMKRLNSYGATTNKHVNNAIRNTNRPRINENFNRHTIEKYKAPPQPILHEPFVKQENKKSLWGRPLWFSLHYGALNYPTKPDTSMQEMTIGFIKGLPIMIPCDVCKNHAYEYISKLTHNQLMDITSTSEKLFRFFWDFHNMVNTKTGKATMTLKDAYSLFENNPQNAL
jgi:hypothetical protein